MRYDEENDILEDISFLENKEIWLMTSSSLERTVLRLLRNYKKKLIDNSGHECEPPDYYSNGSKFMFDVMRINDSEKRKSYNPMMIKERKIQKELCDELMGGGITFEAFNSGLIVNAIPDEDYDKAHNYKQYFKQFSRTVEKHLKQIENCKKKHNDYKMGFLIFDETDLYVECISKEEASKPITGPTAMRIRSYHVPTMDENFMEKLLDKRYELDFVVWAMPYKLCTGGPYELPRLCIIDLKKYKGSKFYKEYDIGCLRSR